MGRDPICCTHGPSQSCPPTRASSGRNPRRHTGIPTPPDARTVIVGVDTHKHVHVAVAIDSWGIRLRALVVDSGGYQALITWAERAD